MKRRFWLFRSNIRHLEYYHKFTDLETFENECHDFYMLFPIWLLRHDHFDEVTIWRLTNKVRPDIIFNVNGKKYYQRWVRNFTQCLKYPPPNVSLFRGGFREYDNETRFSPKHYGLKLYLGTGKRIYPQWNGKYDIFLQEDEKDFQKGRNCLPFYKTASPKIFFHPRKYVFKKQYDICWPCNFTQMRHKGQEQFISAVAKYPELQKLKIINCGNKPEAGKKMCKKYGVKNIEFAGHVDRKKLRDTLNRSNFGLCMSNRQDGCPRVVTEILMTETPLILSDQTRLLPYYKKNGVIEVNSNNIAKKIMWADKNYVDIKRQLSYAVENIISFDKICAKNVSRWNAAKI